MLLLHALGETGKAAELHCLPAILSVPRSDRFINNLTDASGPRWKDFRCCESQPSWACRSDHTLRPTSLPFSVPCTRRSKLRECANQILGSRMTQGRDVGARGGINMAPLTHGQFLSSPKPAGLDKGGLEELAIYGKRC